MKFRYLILTVLAFFVTISCGSNNQQQKQEEEKQELQQQQGEEIEDLQENIEEYVEEDGDINQPSHIVISKQTMTLRLYDKSGKVIYNFPVAVGKNYGNKQKSGDKKTPEGEFEIESIQPASHWTHDFGDGKGIIEHAYGDWFIRLKTPPHKGIGIHGTHAPESIGTRATEGCIRLNNENLNILKELVKVGMKVTITSSRKDREADGITDKNNDEVGNDNNTSEVVDENTNETNETNEGEVKTEEEKTDAKAEETTEEETEAKTEKIMIYNVKSGDTIYGIANKYNTSKAKILELNPGLDIDKINIGDKIRIQKDSNASTESTKEKAKESKKSDGTYHTHIIEDGDMLGTIARKYDTSVAELKKLNPDLDERRLQLGQEIRVK